MVAIFFMSIYIYLNNMIKNDIRNGKIKNNLGKD